MSDQQTLTPQNYTSTRHPRTYKYTMSSLIYHTSLIRVISSLAKSLHGIYVLTQLLQLFHPQFFTFAHQLIILSNNINKRKYHTYQNKESYVSKSFTTTKWNARLTSINLVISCTFSLFFSLKASRASLYSFSCSTWKTECCK